MATFLLNLGGGLDLTLKERESIEGSILPELCSALSAAVLECRTRDTKLSLGGVIARISLDDETLPQETLTPCINSLTEQKIGDKDIHSKTTQVSDQYHSIINTNSNNNTSRLSEDDLTTCNQPGSPKSTTSHKPGPKSPIIPARFSKHRRSNIFTKINPIFTKCQTEEDVNGSNPTKATLQEIDYVVSLLKSAPLTQTLELDVQRNLAKSMKKLTFQPGDPIIAEGSAANCFYLVQYGNCQCYVKKEGVVTKTCVYGPGTGFGEIALLCKSKRTATVIAIESSTLWTIDSKMFHSVLVKYSMENRNIRYGFIDKVSIFESLSKYEKLILIDAIHVHYYQVDDVIFKRGEHGYDFYIIEEGEVACFESLEPSEDAHIRTLSSGDFFGELALLHHAQRTATIQAKTSPCKLLSINRATFDRLLGTLEPILKRNMDSYNKYMDVLVPDSDVENEEQVNQ
eukprot:CAMPEP_0114991838 /NCGR_PEP_ID=MMETSP0216-20121206/11597_1 /TAXON_ID=223996 /ORGANISM="Protocruzia adherens, Strain Boccale" /LENGTH=456 /DNA_ID=CAMNT_0002355215 /DNA_START=94 /DNA_END=1464 /DNA_ORIENTATION=-